MDSWRKVWREGVVPLLGNDNLLALHKALAEDDPRLIQGATTTPPPSQCVHDWPCEAGCLFAYMGAMEMGGLGEAGDGAALVGDVEEFFAQMCFKVDDVMGEPAACRWLLNWFDETPRQVMLELLLVEVELALVGRMVR